MNIKTESSYKKILISILATLALTACGGGGGGGGGGSSSPAPNPLPVPPEIQKPNIDIAKPDQNTGVVANNKGDIFYGNNENKDKISMSGDRVIGAKGQNVNLGYGKTIEVIDTGSSIVSSSGIDKIRDLTNFSYGIYSKNGEVKNLGTIKLGGDSAIGIHGENSNVINGGDIIGNGNNLIGILGIDSDKTKIVINNNNISLKGNNVIGIKLHNSSGINNGVINVNSKNGIGISVVGKDSIAINNGDININGNGIGIYAGYQATGRNNSTGNINILGSGYGMYANNHGYVLNEGNITLSANAKGAMVADGTGSVAENRGQIVIDSKNSNIKKDQELLAINGGQVINKGTITYTDKVNISAIGGNYIIGATDEKNYGKIKADSINISGNIVIDGDIVKGGYKDSYIFKKVLEANEIKFDSNYALVSDSLLYDSKLERDEEGDYNSKLIRNDKNISDFANSNYLNSAKLLDRYFSEKNYNSLNEEGKKLVDLLDISNIENLNKNLKDLTPNLYGNNIEIAKDISRKFETARKDIIENLGKNSYNFALIGDYSKLDLEDNTVSYKMKTSGFVGSFGFKDSYLSLGYGYSDIDFKDDSKGTTHTLSVAFDKYKNYDDFKLKYGISGDYNFNEVTREMKSFDTNGKSDFDSYLLKVYGDISKDYSCFVDIEPYFGLAMGYYNAEKFDEKSNVKIKIDNQDSFFIEPKIGTKILKKFKNLSFYGALEYSYEFSDNKELKYQYSGIDGKAKIDFDEESGKASFKIGANYIKKDVLFGLEVGKSFGDRENSFVSGKIGYRF